MSKTVKKKHIKSKGVNRRVFLKGAGAVVAAAPCARLLGAPAVIRSVNSNKLNLVAIGCGQRRLYLHGLRPAFNYVALVDPDERCLDQAMKNLVAGAKKSQASDFDPARVKTFSDYRSMYDKIHKEIDAVLIATPDHQHTCPALTAIKLGKHVYCEKPLTHHITEARLLGDAARESNVVTQMGNQGSGTGGHQLLAEWLEAGAIGDLREVHSWHVFASRFGGSMHRPKPEPAPEELDWNDWIGPAPMRPYGEGYHPFAWHGWHDFGTGALGGWGPHMFDAVAFALKLGYPKRVELLEVGDVSEERFPRWSTIRYDFPQRGKLPPISFYWNEGSKPNSDKSYLDANGKPTKTRPHLPEIFAEVERLDKKVARRLAGSGSVFVGEKGLICCPTHGGTPILLPASRRKEFTLPPRTLPRPGSDGIMGDFVRACQAGGGQTFSGFATFSGPMIEKLLVGHLAMRAGLNRPVQWNGDEMCCTNLPELNQYVDRKYRQGWTL
ncbi:MAG: Gfo/Idh/MocA family protein [Thermoguttaceae bacterium]